MKILFTGGGTGGHIYPILAVAEELQKIAIGKKNELELRYFGAPDRYHFLLATNGILVSKILPAKWRRYFNFRNFFDILILFPLSLIQALWKVFWFMPDVLFSKGGPSSLPIVLVCKFYRIPIIIHESDVVPGLANQLASRWADRINIAFESTKEVFPRKEKIALIGNPIRKSLISGEILEPETAKRLFGFAPEKPLILVIGGSQGAVRINDFMIETANQLIEEKIQVLHQTGLNNFEDVKNELKGLLKEKSAYKIVPYFEKDLKDAYSAADVVVSRAGSGSIFEIAAFAKPSILIPLPEAAQNHQTANAYEYAKSGAAIVIESDNLKTAIFLNQLKKLFSEPERLKIMSEAAKKFAKPEAAKIIAEEIIKIYEGQL